eukprot:SAG31_NODE_2287_length_6004_cov_2.142954_4_plen_272_part_00
MGGPNYHPPSRAAEVIAASVRGPPASPGTFIVAAAVILISLVYTYYKLYGVGTKRGESQKMATGANYDDSDEIDDSISKSLDLVNKFLQEEDAEQMNDTQPRLATQKDFPAHCAPSTAQASELAELADKIAATNKDIAQQALQHLGAMLAAQHGISAICDRTGALMEITAVPEDRRTNWYHRLPPRLATGGNDRDADEWMLALTEADASVSPANEPVDLCSGEFRRLMENEKTFFKPVVNLTLPFLLATFGPELLGSDRYLGDLSRGVRVI